MKKIINTIAFVLIYLSLNAQPIPPSGYNHGGGGTQPSGGGAPVDDGLIFLIVLGIIWGCWKSFYMNKHKESEKDGIIEYSS
jgi:hypothetical protein